MISDLKHILFASQCGAVLNLEKLPLSVAMQESVNAEKAIEYALTAGDDYELLFSVSEEQKSNLELALANSNVPATCIGQLNGVAEKLELKLNDQNYAFVGKGFEHFNG